MGAANPGVILPGSRPDRGERGGKFKPLVHAIPGHEPGTRQSVTYMGTLEGSMPSRDGPPPARARGGSARGGQRWAVRPEVPAGSPRDCLWEPR